MISYITGVRDEKKKKKIINAILQWKQGLLCDKRIHTTQNLLRITFSFNDLMLKTNRLKKDFFL